MPDKRTFKPEPFPTAEEQEKHINLHDGIHQASIRNMLQILTPPKVRGQWPEIRVLLLRSPQTVIFNIPRAAKFFLLNQILIHYPTDTAQDVQGPILSFHIEGIDDALVDDTTPADARLFTGPNVDPDPATTSTADNSSYISGLNFNLLIRNKGFIKLKVFGYDGSKPEWVDMIIIGRNVMNRQLLKNF